MYELSLGITNTRLEAIDNQEVNKNVNLIETATDWFLIFSELQVLKNRATKIATVGKFLRGTKDE